MKKSIIIVRKNLFIHNGEEYDFDNVNEITCLFKPNIKIIISEENLHVTQFTRQIKANKINKFVDYKINNDFPQNGDILYDFEKNNNVITIYYIKGAKKIEKLLDGAKNIEVKPIQFIIKDVMMKILKSNSFDCKVLLKFNEYYYYVSFKDGLICYDFVEKDKDLVFDKLIQKDDFGEVYVDNALNDIFIENNFEIIKTNIGELINEKIYEK